MKKVLLLVICLGLITGCGCTNKKDNTNQEGEGNNNTSDNINDTTEINDNAGLVKEETINGILFYNQSLFKVGNDSLFEVTLKNVTGNTISVGDVNISLKNSEGNEIVSLIGLVEGDIESNGEKVISCYFNDDISKVVSATYELK